MDSTETKRKPFPLGNRVLVTDRQITIEGTVNRPGMSTARLVSKPGGRLPQVRQGINGGKGGRVWFRRHHGHEIEPGFWILQVEDIIAYEVQDGPIKEGCVDWGVEVNRHPPPW